MRNRTIITSLLLFYWRIYHFPKRKVETKIFLRARGGAHHHPTSSSFIQHPILILFVNNKIPNFFGLLHPLRSETSAFKIDEAMLSVFVCLIIV